VTSLAFSCLCPSPDQTKTLDQPDDFLKWGKKILAWLRKQTPERHGTYRVTSKVADALKSGLEIVL
jgi:hypothetical protein